MATGTIGDMNQGRTCRRCGTPVGADVAQGLCPACLLEQAMGGMDETAAMRNSAAAGQFAPANLPQPAELAKLFPQLEILELLGRGGMGVVYKARQRGLDRLVALKILPPGIDRDPGFQERFVREARALARLSHPNIVAVHDFGQAGGLYYFLMEFVDGVNLREMLRGGHLTPVDALAIVPQVCDALQFAHEEGIVHRDIKPENILVDKKGRVKIADFGLAKIVTGGAAANAPRDYTLTAPQMVMGTPHYMAPEQLERPATVDHRADIYSLGVVFYEMLTGELPLGRFPPPSRKFQLDVRLDDVVLRTLEKEPQYRYQRVGEVKTELATLATASPPAWSAARSASATPPPLQPVPPQAPLPLPGAPPRLSRTAVVGVVWAVLGLVGLLAFLPVSTVRYIDQQAMPAMEAGAAHDAQAVHGETAITEEVVRSAEVTQDASGQSIRSEAAHADPPRERADRVSRVQRVARAPAWVMFVALPIGLVAFTAPFGTTILGLIAVMQIRNSRGRLYGLPLALLDSILFPVLVLDAIVFAFWYWLMPSPNVGFGIALAAACCLVIDALVIAWAWRALSGEKPQAAPPAQPGRPAQPPPAPAVHHQQYAMRPRHKWPLPARLLLWAMVLGVVAGVVGLALPGMFARPIRAEVIESPSNAAQDQPGMKRFRYYVNAPAGYKVTFWAELWKDGALRPLPGFSHTQSVVPARDLPFQGYVELSMEDQDATGRDGQARWVWKFNSSQGNSSTTAWVPDPFLGTGIRDASWTGVNQWRLGPGRTYSILIVRGDKDRLEGRAGDPHVVRDADVEVTLKCRLDRVSPHEQRDGPRYTSSRHLPDQPGEAEGHAEDVHGHGDVPPKAEGFPDAVPVPSPAPLPAPAPPAPGPPAAPPPPSAPGGGHDQ